MTNPVLKKATNTAIDTTDVKYGAPDIVKLMNILDGTHSTERIQINVIEGRDKNSPPFLFLVRPAAAGGFEAIRGTGHPSGSPGTIDYSGSEFRSVINSTISSLPDDASSAEQSQGVIYLQGNTLNCATGTININRAITLDGLGTAVIKKTGEYTDIRTAIIQCARSNITIRNLTVYDEYQNPGAYNPNSDARASVIGITCGPPPQHPTCKNLLIENVFFKNIYYHAVDISAATGRVIDHLVIRNCIADHSGSNTPAGSSFNIGVGVKDALIDNNKIYEPGHTGIDIWGVLEHTKCTNNYVYKNVKPDGCGIAIARFPDHVASEGLAEDCTIMNNRVYGPIAITGIKAHAEARKVTIMNNFVDGTLGPGIEVSADHLPEDPAGVDRYGREILITNNIIRNVGENGVVVNADSTITTPHGILVANNYINNVKRHGVNLASNVRWAVINANVVNGYGMDTVSGTYSGVHLRFCKNCNVTGNTLFGNGTNSTYSVWEEGTSSQSASNIITSNNCNKSMSLVGGNNTVSANNIVVAA